VTQFVSIHILTDVNSNVNHDMYVGLINSLKDDLFYDLLKMRLINKTVDINKLKSLKNKIRKDDKIIVNKIFLSF
jgi:hypothetical protein